MSVLYANIIHGHIGRHLVSPVIDNDPFTETSPRTGPAMAGPVLGDVSVNN